MSNQGIRESVADYAVVWRAGDGPTSSGGLRVGANHLVLRGASETEDLRIPLDDLSSIEVGRGLGERINGQKSVVLERRSCERVLIAAFSGIGLVDELCNLLARLRAERAARARAAVILPIRGGTADAARRLVAEGPPFDIDGLGLERHHVFVSEREVVFFFEGDSGPAAIEVLSRSANVLKAALRWRRIVSGPPRLAYEQFGWQLTSAE